MPSDARANFLPAAANDPLKAVEVEMSLAVTVAAWSSGYADAFKRVVEELLLPVIGKDIVMSFRHGQARAPHAPDGRFHLFVGQGETTGGYTSRRPWGLQLGDYHALEPQGDGQVIAEESEIAMAELYEDRLYVLCSLCYNGSPTEVAVFRRLLEEAVVERSYTPEQKAGRREAARIQSRAAYVTECAKRFEKTVSGTKKAIADGHAAIAKLQTELVKKIRETRGAERKLEQLEVCAPAEVEKYGQEFDKLLQVPKVRRVEAKEGKVNVFTEVLFCTDPRTGKRHEIGAFRIELDANRGVPSWFNLTRQVDGHKSRQMAPHIWADGSACLGNTTEVFPELIGNYEFAAAAMVAIQFVESVNTDDGAGQHISNWPEAPALEVARA